MFVNLLDLNDNDPTFQNLPFVAEVVEGTPAGVSIFQVGFHFLAVPALCHLPHLIPTSQQGGSGCCCARFMAGTWKGRGRTQSTQAWRSGALRGREGRLSGGRGA